MAEVKIQEGESVESALRRFKRKVQQEDIIKDINRRAVEMKIRGLTYKGKRYVHNITNNDIFHYDSFEKVSGVLKLKKGNKYYMGEY